MFWRVAAALVALTAGACTAPGPLRPSAPPPSVLRIALGGVPSSLDPALQRDPWERGLASLYTEALLRPRPDLGDVAPAAASSYDVSADGLTYTFHLRSDGRFAGGRQVTATDFLDAWRRLIDPRTASPSADTFASLVQGGAYAEALDPDDPSAPIQQALDRLGLRAPDPLTFKVTLARPAAWFKWVATLWAGAPVGNGPYRVAAQGGGIVTLLRNPYYRPQAKIAKILAYELGAGSDALRLFRTGALDIAPLDLASAATVSADRTLRSEVRMVPQLTSDWLVFNCFRVPLGSAPLRRALSEALDREAFAAGPLGGLADPSFQLLPAGLPGALPAGDPGLQAYDPADARRQLAAAGLNAAGLHVLVRDTPSGRAFGAFVHDQLASHLGLEVTVDAVSAQTFAQRIGSRQFDLAGLQRWTGDYPDPQNWLDLFLTSNGANAGRWQDPLYDALVGLGDSSTDAAGRLRAYRQAELEIDAQAPAAFLAQDVAWVLVSPRLRGLAISAYDPAPVLGISKVADLRLSH